MTNQKKDDQKKQDPLKEALERELKNAENEEKVEETDGEVDIDQPKSELEEAQEKIADLTEVGQRALADLANFKRRVEQERSQFVKAANTGLILELLPILDNFQRAMDHVPEELQGNEWTKGIEQIEKQFVGAFERLGVQELEVKAGDELDVEKHEALMQEDGEKDTVLGVLEKGYILGDRVLRPAKVKVGNGN
jgi:molecular chaperone GrpE